MPVPPIFAVTIACHFIPLLATSARLWHRKKRRQLWWDDFWAGIAMLATIWIIVQYFSVSLVPMKWWKKNPRTHGFTIWMSYLSIPTAMWTARFSIVVSVVRLLPQSGNRKITQASFLVFALMYISVMVGKVTMCGVPITRFPRCSHSRRANAISLSCNLVSTTWLLSWPVYLLYRMKLKPQERKPILACFLGAVSLIAVDIAHAIHLLQAEKLKDPKAPPSNWIALTITGNLQSIFAILCANALVLVMYIYRAVRKIEVRRVPVDSSRSASDNASGPSDPEITATMTGTNSRGIGSGSTGLETSIISRLTSVYTRTGDFESSFGVSNDTNQRSSSDPAPRRPLRVQVGDSSQGTASLLSAPPPAHISTSSMAFGSK